MHPDHTAEEGWSLVEHLQMLSLYQRVDDARRRYAVCTSAQRFNSSRPLPAPLLQEVDLDRSPWTDRAGNPYLPVKPGLFPDVALSRLDLQRLRRILDPGR